MSNTPTCSLSLELLGPFRMHMAGQNLPTEKWKSKKALLLLKYLATRYGEKVPSEVLIDVLWSDKDFKTSIHTLHSTIYSLRKTLRDHTPTALPPPQWIQSGDGLYWLDPSERVSIDVQDFLKLIRESEHKERPDPERSLETGLQALALYRGTFLPENIYDEWTQSVRRTCCTKYVELALRTGRLLVAIRRDYKGAAAICRTALRHDPYREELYQLLMGCLIAMGRSPEAILQYNNCAKILRDEFGLEPCAELKALLKAIREGSAAAEESAECIQAEVGGVLACDRAVFEMHFGLRAAPDRERQRSDDSHGSRP